MGTYFTEHHVLWGVLSAEPESWAGTIRAHAVPGINFKRCCMQTGRYDGAQRNQFYREIEDWITKNHPTLKK